MNESLLKNRIVLPALYAGRIVKSLMNLINVLIVLKKLNF